MSNETKPCRHGNDNVVIRHCCQAETSIASSWRQAARDESLRSACQNWKPLTSFQQTLLHRLVGRVGQSRKRAQLAPHEAPETPMVPGASVSDPYSNPCSVNVVQHGPIPTHWSSILLMSNRACARGVCQCTLYAARCSCRVPTLPAASRFRPLDSLLTTPAILLLQLPELS